MPWLRGSTWILGMIIKCFTEVDKTRSLRKWLQYVVKKACEHRVNQWRWRSLIWMEIDEEAHGIWLLSLHYNMGSLDVNGGPNAEIISSVLLPGDICWLVTQTQFVWRLRQAAVDFILADEFFHIFLFIIARIVGGLLNQFYSCFPK